MKKIIILLLTGLVISSGFGVGTVFSRTPTSISQNYQQLVSEPQFQEKNNYLTVTVKESVCNLLEPGKPMLPIIAQSFRFPFGTRIDDIYITVNYQDYFLSQKIEPTSAVIPTSDIQGTNDQRQVFDTGVYSSNEWYPSAPYDISKTVGLYQGVRVLTVSIRVYPLYAPATDLLRMPTSITTHIEHQPPQPQSIADTYDLVIITDEKFVSALQPLADHKIAHNVPTMIKTTQQIYESYSGRDDQESIKLFIKDAIETYDIKYVLLAGGHIGQTRRWYVPERLSNNWDSSESGYASDLYYADIYKYNDTSGQYEFEDWDSNHNGIFAEWKGFQKDIMDYDPDVAVGRLPFRYTFEIKPVVNKIITYETSADDTWFKQAKVISGDTGPPCRGPAILGIYEGELATNISANLLESIGFTVDRLFLSQGAWSGRPDIIREITEGCGFIHMAGHGNPAYWGNFLPDAQSEEGMVDGLLLQDMPKLRNKEKLPVIIVGGCHNAQFNVTMTNLLFGFLHEGFQYFKTTPPYGKFWSKEWIPRDFCTGLVFRTGGGAIASMGCAGLGLGYFNVVGLGDWLEGRFFSSYVNLSLTILGEAHNQALRDYIYINGRVNTDQGDRKTIEEWTLIGDPSLAMGGYPE